MARKPRIPKPWPRKDRNNDWYVTIKQKQHYLAPADASPEEVQRALAVLIMDANVERKGDDAEVVAILGRFLQHVEKDQGANTFYIRRRDLRSFITFLRDRNELHLAVSELQPYHITQWFNDHPKWGGSTKRIVIGSLMSGLNWAVAEGYISRNPLQGRVKRPPRRSRGREVYIDEETYKEWLGWCRHPAQKYILMALCRTGCRPEEVISLGQVTGTGLDENLQSWVVSCKRTKANPDGLRVVPIDSLILDLTRMLRQRHPRGHIFRNCRGTPWTVHLVGQMFRRFRLWSALLHPERASYYAKLIPYGCRHTWATNRLLEGESDTLVARHLGHHSTAILHQHYNHVLGSETRRLVEKQKRVDGESI